MISVTKKQRGPDPAAALEKLTKQYILVGIRDTDGSREKDGEPSNAKIGFLNEFGSPAKNLPARPFLRPGVRGQEKWIASKFRAAARAAAAGDEMAVDQILEKVALRVPDGVREYMRKGIPPPLLSRQYARRTQSMRDSEIEEINRRFKGKGPSEQFANVPTDRLNIPLINTGQLRDSIKGYVIKGEDNGTA